jgi:hypothetical protein
MRIFQEYVVPAVFGGIAWFALAYVIFGSY